MDATASGLRRLLHHQLNISEIAVISSTYFWGAGNDGSLRFDSSGSMAKKMQTRSHVEFVIITYFQTGIGGDTPDIFPRRLAAGFPFFKIARIRVSFIQTGLQ